MYTSPHTVSGLTANTEYEVQVRGTNSDGVSPYGESGEATTDSGDLIPALATIADIVLEQGVTVNQVLPEATGGNAPITYSATGLAANMTFTAATRTLAWAGQTTPSTTEITYVAEDVDGDKATRTFNVIVLLALDDFVLPTNHVEFDVGLVLAEPDSNDFFYRDETVGVDESTDTGMIVGGSVEPEAGYRMSRIRRFSSTVFQLNDNPDSDDLANFFAEGGAGNDLIIYLQDAQGVASFPVATTAVLNSGSNHVRWTVPTAFQTVMNRIQDGDRFILAFSRSMAPPVVTFTTAAGILHGNAQVTIEGTVSDVEDPDGNVGLSASTTLGSIITPTNTNGAWSTTLTTPAHCADSAVSYRYYHGD